LSGFTLYQHSGHHNGFLRSTSSPCRESREATGKSTDGRSHKNGSSCSIKQFINEQINTRLQSALEGTESVTSQESVPEDQETEEIEEVTNGVETTAEELEGYHIVRAILAQITDANRVTHKDTKSYFNVLLENNTWKPICRLYFNSKNKKRIGLFDKEEEEKLELDSVSDIYKYSDRLRNALLKYDQGKAA